ncbi:MarR family winged helix-turn-helix transcriptional regulator [Agrobacterium larrymoorei]|uniref:MarR family transcriptional regulator n=1 Tax=Agrobacterium larrymoorei TaxID=160699 RepID=A0AAF0HCZ6_9HYPH|nr:MarR family transcriptional regulator [Agrobacterium larrymoorei]WHA42230.1 MarR family transcriptional regulator [Agrobacterium larrymoorei]
MSKNSNAWLTLTHAIADIEAELGKVLQDKHRLGLSEYRAMKILSQSPNSELRMQDLAKHLNLNQSSVSRMVERLERSELTIRDLCPDDKRGVYTVLTDKGRSHLEQASDDYEGALEAALIKHNCKALLSSVPLSSTQGDTE